jgi:hypothetical protein
MEILKIDYTVIVAAFMLLVREVRVQYRVTVNVKLVAVLM